MITREEATRTVLIATVAALLGFGAIMVYSTTARGDGAMVDSLFVKQLLYITIGLCFAFVLGRIDYHRVLKCHKALLAASVVLLVLVLIPGVGTRVNGASRWLRVPVMGVDVGFQPSEMAKLAIIAFLAAFLGARMDALRSFTRGFLPAVGAAGLICVLIIVEPDIGTTALVAATTWVMLFVGGARLTHLFAPALAAVPAFFFVASKGYARARIEAWLDPWQDPAGTGYHIIQSILAIGSGGLTGVGLGASSQKLFFLPESSSDFIFAILAEEMGLIGASAVLVFYGLFIMCGISIARRAADDAGRLLAVGVTTLIGMQAIINIGVVTQVFPTKGIPLPFISAGGSAVVFMLMGVGMLYSVARHSGAAPVDSQVE